MVLKLSFFCCNWITNKKCFWVAKWLEPAARSEFFIKAGLVVLGTTIIFGEIMKAGSLGMVQAIIVILLVWNFSFWLSKKLGIDKEMGVLLSTAVSICGVSAAIAASGAMKGDSKKLSFVVSLVLVVAVPMMYLMPFLAKLMGLTQEVAGAWLGVLLTQQALLLLPENSWEILLNHKVL